MNIASNPWSFVPADIVTAVPTASPNGLIQAPNASGFTGFNIVNLTTVAAHGFNPNDFVTIIAATLPAYNGHYKVRLAPTATTAVLENISSPTQGSPINSILAPSGGGNIFKCQYNFEIKIKDMMWTKDVTALDTIDVRDRNGNIVWQQTMQNIGYQGRGGLKFINGITLVQMSGGVLLLTQE